MAVSFLVIPALAILGVGLIVRFLALARRRRIFQTNKETLASQFFAFNYIGAAVNFLFQIRLFKAGIFRWMIHLIMMTGFIYLVLVHALDDWTAAWFNWYQPGIDPFRFLRNLAGLMVLAGTAGFLVRRTLGLRINLDRKRRGRRFRVRGTLTILLIMGIILTGILTEGFQIISPHRFDEMVKEYSDLEDDPDLIHLEAYWEKFYHIRFYEKGGDRVAAAASENRYLDLGASLNDAYCLHCHTLPDSAFLSAPLGRLAGAAGNWPVRWQLDRVCYWIHLTLVMLLAACLPFSRMFHFVAIPLASLRRRITPDRIRTDMGYLDLAALSACTHCGFCSQVCSVYPDYQISENPQVLPHVKLDTLKRLAGSGILDPVTLTRLRSGNDDCTCCGLCADICPSGIDLVRLWKAADHVLDRMGCPDNYTTAMETPFHRWGGAKGTLGAGSNPATSNPARSNPSGSAGSGEADSSGILLGLMKRAEAFEHCVQCTLCTNACPVVAHDLEKNDLGPHQIMNMLRLGQQQMASGSRMVWHCLTCYMCQEICPQSIRVADIMLELRCRGQERAAALTLSQMKGERP